MRLRHLVLLLFLPTQIDAQSESTRVIGRVFESNGRDPIVGATVRIGRTTATTDQRGSFSLSVAVSGRQLVEFEMPSYGSRSDSVSIADGQTVEITARLSKTPIALPPIVAVVRSRWLDQNGYYERRTSGLVGNYVTAADIAKRNPARFTDLFHGVPGLKVQRSVRGVHLIRMNHSATDGQPVLSQIRRPPGCEPGLWIDGVQREDRSRIGPPDWVRIEDWDILSPLIVDAIEIYTGSAAPINYQHPCGVVLVWTRRNE